MTGWQQVLYQRTVIRNGREYWSQPVLYRAREHENSWELRQFFRSKWVLKADNDARITKR